MVAAIDPALVEQFGWVLFHSLWQAAAIAAILAVVLRFLRQRSADVRYTVACTALLLQVSLPVATFLYFQRSTPPAATMSPSVQIRADLRASSVPAPARHDPSLPPVAPVQTTLDRLATALRPVFPWCVGLWLIGVASLTFWRLLGWMGVQRLRSTGEQVPTQWLAILNSMSARLNITYGVRLRQSFRIEVPAVIGFFRPVIVLPASAMTGLPPDLVAALLAHELAHIRRCDYLVNLLQTAIEILMFYHPAIWWVSRQIRHERENCCDDIAAAACGDRVLYARALTSMEELRSLPGKFALAANGGSLISRIRRLLVPTPQSPQRNWSLVALILIVGALAIFASYAYLKADRAAPPAEAVASAAQASTRPSWPPPLSPLRPDDFESNTTEYLIGPYDLLSISITGLLKPDVQTVTNMRVSAQGAISLGEIGTVSAGGRSEQQLKKEIAAWMRQNRGIAEAPVTITVIEARQWTFSILGSVPRPGQYAIMNADFRLRDALSLGGSPTPEAQAAYVGRADRAQSAPASTTTHAAKRYLRILLQQLTSQPDAWNIVIRPGDIIIVTPPERTASAEPLKANLSSVAAAASARVTGIVIRDDGTPISGAKVHLLRRGIYPGKPVLLAVTSAADGAYAFDAVPAGDYRLWALSGNLASRDIRLEGQTISVPSDTGQNSNIKLTMRSGRIIRATIISAADGKPIPGAMIHLPRTDTASDFIADNNGRITIEALTPEPWDVEAMASGKAKVIKFVNLSTSSETAVEFALPEGGTLTGKVTNAEGAPAAGVGINIYPGSSGDPIDYVQTDADGSYRLDFLPLNQSCRVLYHEKAYVNAWETVTLTPETRRRDLNVTLQPRAAGGSVVGTVLDADGKPLAGARVTYYGHSSNDERTVTTGAAGTFRFDDIELVDRFPERLSVRADGWAPSPVSFEPGSKVSPASVTVRMTEKGHRIAGRVVDQKGAPIKGARIYASGKSLPNLRGGSTITDDDGRFKFESLPADIRFDVTAQRFSDISMASLALDTDDVTVTMGAIGAIVGKVVDADTNQPVQKFNVRMRTTNMDSRRLQRGEEFGAAAGQFRLDGLKAGTKMTLVITADGYPIQFFDNIAPTPLGEGDPVLLKLAKSPADHIRIAGRITDAAGKPLHDVEVRAIVYAPDDPQSPMPAEMRFNWMMLQSGQLAIQRYIRCIEQARSAADGTFAFPSLKGPDVDLAYWGDAVPQTRFVDAGKQPAAQREHLDLRVTKPATIRGQIDRDAYPDLASLALASSSAGPPEFSISISRTDKTYTFAAVPAGTYKLHLYALTPTGDGNPTFRHTLIASTYLQIKEGESLQFDLGPGLRAVSTSKPTR